MIWVDDLDQFQGRAINFYFILYGEYLKKIMLKKKKKFYL